MQKQLELGISDEMHPLTVEKRAHREATSAAAEDDAAQRAAMKQRHLAEWDEHADLWYDALFKRNMDLAKMAKLLAETLRIRQVGEAAAHESVETPPGMIDPESRRRRIIELAKEIGLVVTGH